MFRSKVARLGLMIVFAGAGCGDNLPEAITPPFHSRVEGTRQLDMLTLEESDTFCQDFKAHSSDFVHRPRIVEGGCRLRVDQSAPSCEQMKNECIAELSMKPHDPKCPQWSPPCESTVADFERCWTATEWFLAQFFLAIPDCGSTDVSFDVEAAGAVRRAECAAYFDGCPGG